MIFVNTSLDTALERNAKRDRKVPESLVIKSWNDVQKNIGKFSQYFRRNFIVVDNNDSEEDIINSVQTSEVTRNAKVQNPTGLKWIANELAMKEKIVRNHLLRLHRFAKTIKRPHVKNDVNPMT